MSKVKKHPSDKTNAIVSYACELLYLRKDYILSTRREPEFCDARSMICAAIMELIPEETTTNIVRALNRENHTTAIHWRHKHNDLYTVDADYKHTYDRIMPQLRSKFLNDTSDMSEEELTLSIIDRERELRHLSQMKAYSSRDKQDLKDRQQAIIKRLEELNEAKEIFNQSIKQKAI